MNKTKYDLEAYKKFLDKNAKTFKLSGEDLSNLFDVLTMMDTPDEVCMSIRKTLQLNKLDEWFYKFKKRVEDVVIWDFGDRKRVVSEYKGGWK